MRKDKPRQDQDAAVEAGGRAGGLGQGDSLKDASDEAVREMTAGRDGSSHAGRGDAG